jgi:hypothetical protein
MGRPGKPVDEALMVGMYRKGMSLRGVAAMQGVSQTTVASCLEKAGQLRRGTQEENQRRWPRLSRVCAACNEPFAVRQGHLARGDKGLFCSKTCYDVEQRQGELQPIPMVVKRARTRLRRLETAARRLGENA